MLRTTRKHLTTPLTSILACFLKKCKNCFSIVLTVLQADDSAGREAVVHSAFLAEIEWAKPADVMATVCCGCARTNQPSSQRRESAGTGFTTSQHGRGVWVGGRPCENVKVWVCACDDEQMIKYACLNYRYIAVGIKCVWGGCTVSLIKMIIFMRSAILSHTPPLLMPHALPQATQSLQCRAYKTCFTWIQMSLWASATE